MTEAAPARWSSLRVARLVARSLLPVVIATVVIAIIAFGLMKWRRPTRVALDLTVNRAVIDIGGAPSTNIPLLGGASVRSITLSNIEKIELFPQSVERGDQNQIDLTKGRYMRWNPVKLTTDHLKISCDPSLHANVTLENSNYESDATLSLEPLLVPSGSQVILETKTPSYRARSTASGDTGFLELYLSTFGTSQSQHLVVRDSIDIYTEHCKLEGTESSPSDSQTAAYRVKLRESDRSLSLVGHSGSLGFNLVVPVAGASELFPQPEISASRVEFLREESLTHSVESALVKGATSEITYPGYPDIARVSFAYPDFVRLRPAPGQQFNIRQLGLVPETGALRLQVVGLAETVQTIGDGLSQDHRLTVLKALQRNSILLVILGVLGWAVPLIFSARKLVLELRVEVTKETEQRKKQKRGGNK